MERLVSEVEFCNLAYDGNLLKMQASLDADPSLSDRRDSNQRTALHWACSSGQTAVVGFLLVKGAEVNIVVDPGTTTCTVPMTGSFFTTLMTRPHLVCMGCWFYCTVFIVFSSG